MIKTITCLVTLLTVVSCTNVQFKKVNFGPKGVDFTKGACLVNDLIAPISKEGNEKLTALTIKYLHEMGCDSVISLKSLRASGIKFKTLPSNIGSGLIDSLKIHTNFYYLVDITSESNGTSSNDITVNPSDFQDDFDGRQYLDNEVSVKITVFNIHSNEQLYKQKTTAAEFVDTESESELAFTRSHENIFKNALTRGLKDLRKHSKK